MDALLVVVALSIPIALNVWASRLLLLDEFATTRQRNTQLALVWLLPLVGAILVAGIHRKSEPPAGSYRSELDPGDDYTASGKSVRGIQQAIDGD